MSAIAFNGSKDSGKTISAKIFNYLITCELWEDTPSFKEFKNIIQDVETINILSFATNLKKALSITLDINIHCFNDREYKDKFWFNPCSRSFITDTKLNKRILTKRTLKIENYHQIGYDIFNDKDVYIRLRLLLQWFGTDIGQRYFGKNIWINPVIRKIKDNPSSYYIIDDVRFKAEYDTCINNNINVYKIINSKLNSKDTHISENDLDNIMWNTDKIIIWNGEDLEELYNKIKKIFDYEFTRSK